MNIPQVNIKPKTITDYTYAQRFVRGMELRGLAPLILLETFVTSGRTVQAYKRGGFIEARERFTEEATGALFWFAGVKVFNRINDKILKHLMHIENTNFDAGKDAVRDPLKNYLKWAKDSGQNLSKSKIAAFKAIKISASILLANGLVGFVVPKINQAITRFYYSKQKNEKLNNAGYNNSTYLNKTSMQNFLSSDTLNDKDNKDKKVAFKGISSQTVLNLAHKFENDTTYQLLSTDVGISGGRVISSRNNHERIEVSWRDLSSIFFYMFNMRLVNSALNLMEHGRPTRLNPVNARQVTDYMKDVLEATGHHDSKMNKLNIAPHEFAQIMLGDMDVTSQMVKFKKQLKDGSIKLDEFLDILKKEFSPQDYAKYSNIAERMSKLQPKIEDVSILSESQVKAIFKGGELNRPEFWDSVFTVSHGIEDGIANHKNPFKYVPQKELDQTITNIAKYVKGIIKKADAKRVDIDLDMLEKAYKNNMFKNTINWGTGFAISALFLSTIIPKVQYWITRKTTGSNEFPGVANYDK